MRQIPLEDIVEILGIESLHPGTAETTDRMAKLLDISDNDHILEVGSGSGESAARIAGEYNCTITGIDISPRMVELTNEKAAKNGLSDNIKAVVCGGEQLTFEDETFDKAFSEAVISKLDQKKCIAELTRVVKKGGKIAISDFYWRKEPDEKSKQTVLDIEGLDLLQINQWIALCEASNLVVKEVIEDDQAVISYSDESLKEIGLQKSITGSSKLVAKHGLKAIQYIYNEAKLAGKMGKDLLHFFTIIAEKPE